MPPCDATCCHALAHEALAPSPLRDAMCQQLVRMRTRGGGDAQRAQRSAKKAETKGRAPSAAKAGHMAIWAGAEAKAIEEIDL